MANDSPLPGSLFTQVCVPDCADTPKVTQAPTEPGQGAFPVAEHLLISRGGVPLKAGTDFKISICNLPIDELIDLLGGNMDPCCPSTNALLTSILAALNTPQTPQLDGELVLLCNAVGDKVLVRYDVAVSPPVETSRWNLTTQAAEPAGPLQACADAAGVETVATKACLAGEEIPGFVVMSDAVPPAVLAEIFRDPATGTWGALPAGATVGACPVAVPCTVSCTTSNIAAPTAFNTWGNF